MILSHRRRGTSRVARPLIGKAGRYLELPARTSAKAANEEIRPKTQSALEGTRHRRRALSLRRSGG